MLLVVFTSIILNYVQSEAHGFGCPYLSIMLLRALSTYPAHLIIYLLRVSC